MCQSVNLFSILVNCFCENVGILLFCSLDKLHHLSSTVVEVLF